MAYTISKGSGPRREDRDARKLIQENRGTIERIADQISNGGYSASRKAAVTSSEPQLSGRTLVHLGAAPKPAEPRPYVRISPNRRVVVLDLETCRQLHHLGNIKREEGVFRFRLATEANGFVGPVDQAIASRLAALDGAVMGGARDNAALAAEITALLGYE
jgi:hypothetical protein